MANSKEKLFSEFAPATTQEWKDKAVADLKGADYEKKLVWKTNEGFSVQPFYRQEDIASLATTAALPGEFPYVRGNKKDNNEWLIRQNIEVADFAEANAKARQAIERGATSVCFSIKGKMLSAEGIATLLEGICTCVELNFCTCQGKCLQLADILIDYFTAKGYDLATLRGSINYDPISKLLGKGKEIGDYAETLKALVEKMQALPKFKCVAVNALALNNAGSYISQELGYALAWGNEYLNTMVEAGVPVDVAAKKMKFNFGISSNYFMEIAKFRAARMLWATIVKQYEPKCDCACKMNVCAITTEYNQTMYDSYVNLLRTQTEAMSAAIANVDSIVVVPFDKTYQTPDDFSERLARNQQLLLKEEAHFDKIVDVAGGSYYIEHLTNAIAEEAWKLFLSVENEGGFLALATAGKIQEIINATNKTRHANAAKRKEFLLGTNQFPNFNEKAEGKTPVCGCKCGCGDKQIGVGRADGCRKNTGHNHAGKDRRKKFSADDDEDVFCAGRGKKSFFGGKKGPSDNTDEKTCSKGNYAPNGCDATAHFDFGRFSCSHETEKNLGHTEVAETPCHA